MTAFLLMACKGVPCHGNHVQPTVDIVLNNLIFTFGIALISICVALLVLFIFRGINE